MVHDGIPDRIVRYGFLMAGKHHLRDSGDTGVLWYRSASDQEEVSSDENNLLRKIDEMIWRPIIRHLIEVNVWIQVK